MSVTSFRKHASWLIENLPEPWKSQIDPAWCWLGIRGWYRKSGVPEEVVAPLREAIVESGDVETCVQYCMHIENHEDVVRAIVESEDGMMCYWYCRFVEDRREVWQAVAEFGDRDVCDRYCHGVADRPEVRAVFENR